MNKFLAVLHHVDGWMDGWMDGATDQLSAVNNAISEQCLSQRNIKAKQSAAKQGGEQSSGIGDGFKDVKRSEQTPSIEDIPNDSLLSLFLLLLNEWKENNEVNLGCKQPIAVEFCKDIIHSGKGISTSFDELFQEMYESGHVEESSFDCLGCPHYFEGGEEGVDRDVGIERENMQCAKPLSHPEQVILRDCLQEKHPRKENDQLKINADK
eukprot:3400550-Ditylum_brightwellii.AAC.1